jgi:type II secretory pathway pseudopilin PulG
MRHQRCQGGFTISEVVLAIGVVAFGLVAVLGVLPVGLAATKDNREETIIRYEALYWINALRAGAQKFDALDQVEWAEVVVIESVTPTTTITNVYRAHRNRLGGDGWGVFPNLIGALNRGHNKQNTWPTDVIGWLSIPNNGTVKTKTVLVRPMNSTLFDRIYGRKLLVANKSSYTNNSSSTIYHPLDGGDLAFAYLLEVSITKPDPSLELHKVELTFSWPVLDDPTIENPAKNASDMAKKTISKMVFTTEIFGGLEQAVTSYGLSYGLKIDDADYPLTMPPEDLSPNPQFWDAADKKSIRGRHTVESILEIVSPGEVLPGEEEVTVDYLKDWILAPRYPMPDGPVVVGQGDSYFIRTNEIRSALNFLKRKGIMEVETGSAAPAVPIWSMRRQPYSGYGHFSMRPMTGATDDDGGYVPLWWSTGRLRGFESPSSPLPYFSPQYFFTPDNQ